MRPGYCLAYVGALVIAAGLVSCSERPIHVVCDQLAAKDVENFVRAFERKTGVPVRFHAYSGDLLARYLYTHGPCDVAVVANTDCASQALPHLSADCIWNADTIVLASPAQEPPAIVAVPADQTPLAAWSRDFVPTNLPTYVMLQPNAEIITVEKKLADAAVMQLSVAHAAGWHVHKMRVVTDAYRLILQATEHPAAKRLFDYLNTRRPRANESVQTPHN